MSYFYTVRLRRFNNDEGYTGGQRNLRNVNRGRPDGVPLKVQEEQKNGAAPANPVGASQSRRISLAEEVIFHVSPTISESRSVNYVDHGMPAPQGLIVYETTNNRRWSISARFVSRNITEGIQTFQYMNLLKSWTVPQPVEGDGIFARPPILRLNGYKSQFRNIPVVLSSLTFNFPEDVDYIEAGGAMVPIIQTVDLEVIEAHQIVNFDFLEVAVTDKQNKEGGGAGWGAEFNLKDFKAGILPGY